jgi:hypothetical protein
MNTGETRLSLAEFKSLSGVPSAVLVWLLTNNKLPCAIGSEGIEVLLTPAVLDALREALLIPWDALLGDELQLLTERIAGILCEALEEPLSRAVAIASRGKLG